jgi:hypothetical protein
MRATVMYQAGDVRVENGYKAMAERESLKVLIQP